MSKPRVVVLGAGPAGLGAAYRLVSDGRVDVTVLERNPHVGGNAGSFELAGVRVDYGSHRLHPASDPEVLRDIQALLGDDLLTRPRRGRIRLRGRWIKFPPRPLDLLTKLPPDFALGVATDMARKVMPIRSRPAGKESFASVLEDGLGRTICREFYFPFARKIWGAEPEEISAIQAYKRVSANSLPKMAWRVLSSVRGARSGTRGVFLYPRRGYGQISEAYYEAICKAGATVKLGATVEAVETSGGAVRSVRYAVGGSSATVEADFVWSTIPITLLARSLRPELPAEQLGATERIDYRAMILIYLILDTERFSPYDAYYFPETRIPISRLSEPKNFSDGYGARGVTVLCAELPCSVDEPVWRQSDQELGDMLCTSLNELGLSVQPLVREVATRRLAHAYPMYTQGFERHLEQLDAAVGKVQGLLTLGRQGLFSHDNLHHALYMGYAAAECLDGQGRFDEARWHSYRRIFETHVVED